MAFLISKYANDTFVDLSGSANYPGRDSFANNGIRMLLASLSPLLVWLLQVRYFAVPQYGWKKKVKSFFLFFPCPLSLVS